MGVDYPVYVSIAATLFSIAIGVFFFMCFMDGMTNQNVEPFRVPDRFDIGYVDESPVQTVVVKQEPRPKKTKKPKKAKKSKQPKQIKKPKKSPQAYSRPKKEEVKTNDKLAEDCVLALVGLGTKQSDARRAVNRFFLENPGTKTVEEFILEIFKKDVL